MKYSKALYVKKANKPKERSKVLKIQRCKMAYVT